VLRNFMQIGLEALKVGRLFERIPPRSVVAVQIGNSELWPELLLALWKRELIPMPLGDMGATELAYTLGACRAAALVTNQGGPLIVHRRPVAKDATEWRGPVPEFLKLTSGTTDGPRAVRFRGTQLLADCENICTTMGLTDLDVNFGVIPFSHSYGFSNLLLPLLVRGVRLVVSRDRLPRAVLDGLVCTGATVRISDPAGPVPRPALWRGLRRTRFRRHALHGPPDFHDHDMRRPPHAARTPQTHRPADAPPPRGVRVHQSSGRRDGVREWSWLSPKHSEEFARCHDPPTRRARRGVRGPPLPAPFTSLEFFTQKIHAAMLEAVNALMFSLFFVKDKLVFVESLRALAIAGVVFGALLWIPAIVFYSGSSVAVGRIVEVVARSNSEGETFYYPTFTFDVSDGRTQTVESSAGGPISEYQAGKAVKVRYRPERPSDARIENFFSVWGIPVLIQGICVIHLILWSVVLHFIRKNRLTTPQRSAA